MRCLNEWYQDHYFLLDNFISIWGIIWELDFDNFEWYSIIIDIENILKCTKDRVIDYGDLQDLKQHLYFCHDFEKEYKNMWDDATYDIMGFLRDHTNIGAAEANLVAYLENVLLSAVGDSNMLPIWITLMKL